MNAPRRINTVLFDIGNTLLDFETLDPRPFLDQGFRQGYDYLASLGHPLPPFERYQQRMRRGMVRQYLWSRLIRREMKLMEPMIRGHAALGIDLNPEHREELLWRMYLPMRRVGRADAGARRTLLELSSRGYRLAIISNTATPPSALDRHLEEEGLLEFFTVRVYSCEVSYMKPHRRIFQIALDRTGSAAAGAMYVGDTAEVDVRGARRLGLVTVLKSPDGRAVSERWRPDHRIRTLADLPQVIEAYPPPCPSN